jgi:hypothetical protein
MKKSIKNRNKMKSKKRKTHAKRKHTFKGSGTGSSKALSPLDELNRIDKEKETMNVIQKLKTILKLAPEELPSTTAFGKEIKDISSTELTNNLRFLGADTTGLFEKPEYQNSLSNKYSEIKNDTVDRILNNVIAKRREQLMRELRENEEKQRLINLEKQRKQEEQRQRMQEEQRKRMQEEQRRKEEARIIEMQKVFNDIIKMDTDNDALLEEERLQRYQRYPQYPANQGMYSRNYSYPPPPHTLPPFRQATYETDYNKGIIYKTTWNGIKSEIHSQYTHY